MLHRLMLLGALLALPAARAAEEFQPTPYHEVQPGVPQGRPTKFTNWHSKIDRKSTRLNSSHRL